MKVLIFNDTRTDRHHGSEMVMRCLFGELTKRGLHPVTVHRVGESCVDAVERIRAEHPDGVAVIVNGEGSIHHGNERAQELARLPQLLETVALPSYLVNTSLYANPAPVTAGLAGYRRLYVRESASLRDLGEHASRARVCADLTVFATMAAAPRYDGLDPRGLFTDTVLSRDRRVLKRLAKHLGADWRPIRPRGLIERGHAALRRDSPGNFLQALARARFVVTGRFHTVTMCLAVGTPFVAVPSVTPKIEAMLDDAFGEHSRVLESVDALESRIVNRADGPVPGWTEAEKTARERFLEQTHLRTAAMFDDVVNDIRACSAGISAE